eukprot:TRINITY_DN5933_c0_g1_i1.p1 TRINITY_DN5933_c0_g1~~TRINITY_DN5933_c0_g1_i1.p1  ORF type:complete len:303 (-),score=79.90 TRINITY_DN5933_c0_g1_i1:692-1600(-)
MVKMTINASGTIMQHEYAFSEANRQIIGAIFSIINYPLESYDGSDEMIYMYMGNTVEKEGNYMVGLLDTIDTYRTKGKDLNTLFKRRSWLFVGLSLGFTLLMVAIIYGLYLKIRKGKLYVMSFFIHIQGRSLEEILGSSDEFISVLTSTEVHVADEQSEREIIQQSVEEDTGSYTSKSQQIFSKKYKTHHSNHKRMLKDDCNTLCISGMKFLLVFMFISGYIVCTYVCGRAFNSSLGRAGKLSEVNSRVELKAFKLLVLVRESISTDSGSATLSDVYVQVKDLIHQTIELIKGLEDVNLFIQ